MAAKKTKKPKRPKRSAEEVRAEKKPYSERNFAPCSSRRRDGKPCGFAAMLEPAEDGKRYCYPHHPDISEETRKKFQQLAVKSRKSRYPKPHELLRRVVESNPGAFIRPHLEALGLELEYYTDAEGLAGVRVNEVADGAVLFGVSKDGDVVISKAKDLEGQMRASERLLDRVYGKPKQSEKVADTDDGVPVEVIPYDDQRQAEVTEILAKSGVQASAPPAPDPAVNGNGNHDDDEEDD